MKFYSNEENSDYANIEQKNSLYDYVLIDIDCAEKFSSFEMENEQNNYFVTAFDTFSLKKGTDIFRNLEKPINLTKILFSYEENKENEDYLNYLVLGYKVHWNEDYTMYFRILGEDNKVFEENQRVEKIRFKRLTPNYKESLAYVVQDIDKSQGIGKLKKLMKD